MFTPSQKDVREFFCATHAKSLAGTPLTPLETVAAQWISEHPEHHAELADLEAALTAEYKVDGGRANPFLHLSMHLTISEQVSIDQPRGIRQAVELLAKLEQDEQKAAVLRDQLKAILAEALLR